MKRIVNHTGIIPGIVMLAAVTLVGCGSGVTAPGDGTPASATPPGTTASEPPKKPKLVVVGGAEYNFGTTEIGQEFEHVFEIKNEGPGDLHCMAGTPSCTTCTSFKIDKEVVKPGESLKATVKWHIKNPNPEFRQYAPLRMDGDDELRLYVVGKVVKRIVLEPSDKWNLGDVIEGKPTQFVATVTSPLLDKFEIESVAGSNAALKVIPVPMTPEKLKDLKVKSGYELQVSLEPTISVGEFGDRVSINIKAPEPLTLKVDAVAKRTGPLTIFGPNWSEDISTLRLGSFDPKVDFVTRLNLFTRGLEGELKIEKIVCADNRFSVELKPDTKFKGGQGSQRYELLVKVAGSDKPVVYTPQQPLRLEMVTNQPIVGSIKIAILSSQLR